ncbi:high frequency lysogenization protein HflD [Parafrankia sp. FMc2]|uniref:HoxN/HupN/NixA family nickel/cobalt transporter n=1 Tax=Parafrankia sp. FMc2 TaxID=3233196 RepID=UPI0034D67F7A
MTTLRRVAALAVTVALFVLAAGGSASAHPLGSFTVNSASVLRVGAEEVLVDVVADFAEIPAAQVRPDVEAQGAARWREAECARTAGQATLTVDGRVHPLVLTASSLSFPPGDGGLATMRLVCRYSAAAAGTAAAGTTTIRYSLAAYADRVGWRETVAVGDGTTVVSSDVPSSSSTDLLTRYPEDPLGSGSDVTRATLTVRPGGPAAAEPLPPAGAVGSGTPGDGGSGGTRQEPGGLAGWVGGLAERDSLSLGLGVFALLAAVVLGTAHAFAPGHGKTVMAARIVGGSATGRQLAATAGAVTLTHTLGVLVLAVVLSASSGFAPEKIYPWLGVASGLLMVGLGASLLRARLTVSPYRHLLTVGHVHEEHSHDPSHDHDHAHAHAHQHDHAHQQGHAHQHSHTHEHGRTHERGHLREHGHTHGGRWHVHPSVGDQPGLRSLLATGLVGGMVPTPSAVVVLLGAVALGRAWFGVLLVLAYGVGMAATLVGVGFLLDRTLLPLLQRASTLVPGFSAGLRWTPVATAALVVLVGAVVALRAGSQVVI